MARLNTFSIGELRHSAVRLILGISLFGSLLLFDVRVTFSQGMQTPFANEQGSVVSYSSDDELTGQVFLPTQALTRSSVPSAGEHYGSSRIYRSHHADGYPTLDFYGFLQFDSVCYGESKGAEEVLGTAAGTTTIRRARMAAEGDLHENLWYKFDFDFAGTEKPSYRDQKLQWEEVFGETSVELGFFKAPFQFDAMLSSTHFTFAERAPSFTFAPFRQIGIGWSGVGEDHRSTWATSVFIHGDDGYSFDQSDLGYGLAARGTYLPLDEADGEQLLHLGAGYSYLSPSGSVIQYDPNLGFFVDEEGGESTIIPPILDTGEIPTDNIHLANLEIAGIWGSLHYLAEVTYTMVDQIDGPQLMFYGGYGQIGWFLTGESQVYDRRQAVFSAVKPLSPVTLGGIGAWEIAFRGTYLDLDDKNIQGGRLSSAEIVLNWYLCERMSLKLDYVKGFTDRDGEEFEIDFLGGRCQVIY